MASVQFAQANGTVNDLNGKSFGRWTVLGFDGRLPIGGNRTRPMWRCECACGTARAVSETTLLSGASKSCGCTQRAAVIAAGKASATHGQSRKGGLYTIWVGMKARCYTKSTTSYPRYGGRGIIVCDRWRNSFENFASDMGERPSKRHSLDRLDNDGHYTPENCQWRDIDMQNRNKRNNRWVVVGGERITVTDAANRAGVNAGTVRARLGRGWSIERALEPFA